MTKEEMMLEAKRCINCPTKPCQQACPAHNRIPEFMMAIKKGDFDAARTLWNTTSVLPEICGDICQNEDLCEGHCTLAKIKKPLHIGELESAVAELYRDQVSLPRVRLEAKHLVIGLGPAGLANAIRMAELGYQVTAIDKQNEVGGAVNNLVPDFRYDKTKLSSLHTKLLRLGVELRLSTEVGTDASLEELLSQYDTAFIAHGNQLPQKIDIEATDVSVHYAVDLLDKHRYSNDDLMNLLGQRIFIVGLGNVAIDIARTLARIGKQVTIVYRRTLAEAPAGNDEIMEAVNEGVVIRELMGPTAFYHKETENYLDCEETCLIQVPGETRSRVQVIPDSLKTFVLDDLIFATGQQPNDGFFEDANLTLAPELGKYRTNRPNVYVGGDRVIQFKRIVDAMVSGLDVALLIGGKH